MNSTTMQRGRFRQRNTLSGLFRNPSPNSYHEVADSYWALARKRTKRKQRRDLKRIAKINDC